MVWIFWYLRLPKPCIWRFGSCRTWRFGLVSWTGLLKMKTLSSFETSWTADLLIQRQSVASQPSFDVTSCRSATSSVGPKGRFVCIFRVAKFRPLRKQVAQRRHVPFVLVQWRLEQFWCENLRCRIRAWVIRRTVGFLRERCCLYRPEGFLKIWSFFNLLTPDVNYSGRTAPLTSKVAFYIFIQQI